MTISLRPLLLLMLTLAVCAPVTATDPIAPERIIPRVISLPVARIDARVQRIACGVGVLPGRGVYDWRCADPSNRVLLAHAYAAFAPLSRAYDRGLLTRGRRLYVRDQGGRLRVYRLAWARVVWRSMLYRGRGGIFWAYGETARPSVTLITCRGARSTHRLVVRFVLVAP